MARTRHFDTSTAIPLRALPASALRAVLEEGYGWPEFKRDATAGFIVGVIAMPLAMALAIAVGAPPQHGLYTAIVAGFFTALLGGSRLQVSGPTAAFIVILAPIQAKFGLAGLLVSGLMAGLFLIGMGLLRLGRLIEFIPFPVTTGFTSGIALVIAGLQLKDLGGFRIEGRPEHFVDNLFALFRARHSFAPAEFGVGLLTLLILLAPRFPKRWLARLPRALRRIPAPLFALPVAVLLAWGLPRLFEGFHIETIGSRFHSLVNGQLVEGIPPLAPRLVPPWRGLLQGSEGFEVGFRTLRMLLPGALAIALLGAIESLLSAVVADGMARTRHDPDSELIAQGVGNILTPFFGGIPATGAIARTASNFKFGGRSPVAAMTHAVTVLLGILLLAPAIRYLPMASLAALLLLVAWNMSEAEHFIHTVRSAPRSDVAVLVTCFLLTVLFDMVLAVTVGIILASLLFMRRMASLTEGRFTTDFQKVPLPGPLPEGVVIYDLVGALFFGAAERAMGTIRSISEEVRVVIFRMEQVPTIDITGLVALEGVVEELNRHGIKVILVGTQRAVRKVLHRTGFVEKARMLHLCRTMTDAFVVLKARLHHAVRLDLGPIRFHVLHRSRLGARRLGKPSG